MNLDQLVFQWLNGFNDYNDAVSAVLNLFLSQYHFRTVPYMMAFWALWFLPDTAEARTDLRIRLVAVALMVSASVGITRALANFLPLNTRPIHTEGLDVVLRERQDTTILDGWNSMPSDHASLGMALAVGMLLLHRKTGLFLILWTVFIVSVPRIVSGLHWPSDVLAGWSIGALCVLALLPPIRRVVAWSGIVPLFEKREPVGYALLFLLTYEIASLFSLSRYVLLGIIE
ncbi:phosphatase PAP2 family protein [Alphaproteobacteria bacterium GH1-50]|uniref:Phosphatase PAP2 family protein n=1 Tax=Kangsaoukella pontilimi TaxID=2691042 RepID=A0A7C9MYU0_9RHOB|nr:phosphatase PAP2 family protein [Kangsaoukella pontilimi]MXQ06998.1 phosphatase PAP2 family protein [Kangsaoukella pontilimi]